MEKNQEMTISEALKEKIIKSVIFHLATYELFDQLRLMDLKKAPQYQLSASDVEYLNQHQRYLNYMKANDIFSELGSASDGSAEYAKVPLRPFTFGVDDLIKFRKVVKKKMEKRKRTVTKKVFLFIKKKVEEEYEVEVEEVSYTPVVADDVLELCRNIVKKLIEIGYKDARAAFMKMSFSNFNYRFTRSFYPLAPWDSIKNNTLDQWDCFFSSNQVTKVDDDLYEVNETGFSGDSGIAFVTMQFEACVDKSLSNVLQYNHEIRSVAWKYYEAHYGEIDCFK